MKILHLNSNFVYTDIYRNLLDSQNPEIENIIFCPLKKKIEFNSDVYKVFSPVIIKKYHSILSKVRREKSFNYILKNNLLDGIDLIHAHTLTNDGILANKIFKKYKIPFVLTIRNTDVNFSLKYKKHVKKEYKEAIENASLLIFPNYSYKNKLKKFFENSHKICHKISHSPIIPNGIDNYWLQNKATTEKTLGKEINLLFIGRIYKDKNLHRILKAIQEINTLKINLNVIGKVQDQKYFNKLKKKHHFNYLGSLNRYEISEVMKTNDLFIMPSLNETFGLVFIESLTQNLPIIYTMHEGVYGYFDDGKYGVAVDPKNINDITEAINYIVNNYSAFQSRLRNKEFINAFDWNNIGQKYSEIYRKINSEWKNRK
ncbi:glycosyltransferase family 4 protein [Mammaliicoccus sciuri]|uniref:glycosyltransferase family 4 protein n=1 Tax=Mammaliicoccus sciuri TaxID=1296 RepID=UPI000E6A5632|nr:glycosyltransferase family 4 protein [Mammaliicoccus sciuri]RIO09157.1 glycosyltransferase [Mammaliicoccus sciuri]